MLVNTNFKIWQKKFNDKRLSVLFHDESSLEFKPFLGATNITEHLKFE